VLKPVFKVYLLLRLRRLDPPETQQLPRRGHTPCKRGLQEQQQQQQQQEEEMDEKELL
jgi:hypothetical protein